MTTSKLESESSPLSEEQKGLLQSIVDGHVALMSGFFQNHPVAYICSVSCDAGGYFLRPIAIITDNAFIDRHGDEMLNPDRQILERATPSSNKG